MPEPEIVGSTTGGVGNQAVQLAAQGGATVIATAHTQQEQQLVTDLGAAETVDYTGNITTAVREHHPDGVDVVLHLVGNPAPLLPAVRPGGRFVSTLIMSPEPLPTEDVTLVGIDANPDQATLDRCASNYATDFTRVHIQQTYTLDEAPRRWPTSPAAPSASSSSPLPDPPSAGPDQTHSQAPLRHRIRSAIRAIVTTSV